jgi:hypothetical protein
MLKGMFIHSGAAMVLLVLYSAFIDAWEWKIYFEDECDGFGGLCGGLCIRI